MKKSSLSGSCISGCTLAITLSVGIILFIVVSFKIVVYRIQHNGRFHSSQNQQKRQEQIEPIKHLRQKQIKEHALSNFIAFEEYYDQDFIGFKKLYDETVAVIDKTKDDKEQNHEVPTKLSTFRGNGDESRYHSLN